MDELRARLEGERIDYAELLVLGARAKARRLPDRGEEARRAREELAEWIRSGSGPEMDIAAAEEVKHRGLIAKVERLALQAQRELAEVGHHRLPPLDVIVAACAHRAEAGVLHYDRDYDLIARHTGLDFESEWLSTAGTYNGS